MQIYGGVFMNIILGFSVLLSMFYNKLQLRFSGVEIICGIPALPSINDTCLCLERKKIVLANKRYAAYSFPLFLFTECNGYNFDV